MMGPHQPRQGPEAERTGWIWEVNRAGLRWLEDNENQWVCRNMASLVALALGVQDHTSGSPANKYCQLLGPQRPFVRQKALLQVASFRFQVSAGFSASSPLKLASKFTAKLIFRFCETIPG